MTDMFSPGKQLSFVLACLLAPAIIAGVSLNNCGGSSNDKTAEVVRGENSSFTCTLDSAESSHTLEWKVNSSTDSPAGSCPEPRQGDSCTNKLLQHVFTPRRTESTRSVMTIDPTKANLVTQVESGTLICKDLNENQQDSCPMDYITRASGTCSLRVDTDTTPWTVTGDCNITQGNSSLERYMCQWFCKKEGQNTNETAITSMQAMKSSNTLPTGPASCPDSKPLPGEDGRYTYRVKFLPGRQFFPAGTVDISRPSKPTITCTPAGRVTENSTLTCTCSTVNVGQPVGRLRWLRNSSDVIPPGALSDGRLELRQTLTRSDDGVTQFRCCLDWSNVPVTSSVHTASVGYPPSKSELTISQSSQSGPVTVSENTTVTFTCTATGGNPNSTMTLSPVTLTNRHGPSPLTFVLPAARCEHSGVYTCTGNNGYGRGVTETASLMVLCSPRSASQIPALNFINDQVETSFSVTAHPVPALTFSYLGGSNRSTDSPRALSDSIKMNGSCEAKGGMVYQSTCTITVQNVTSDEAVGTYQVTVNNTQGRTNATFEVKYKAPVQPPKEASHAALIIVVIIVAIVIAIVIVAVIIVVCCVCKRRKGAMPEIISRILLCHCLRKNRRSTAAGRPKPGTGQNSYHEMEERGLADAESELASRPLSFAPMAVYAEVDKTKTSKQGAAAQDAEGNAGQPADVYAEVDKTKKKQASGAGAKPKTAAKPKKEKKKDKKDESAHVYGNVEDVEQGKGAKAKKTTKPSKEETSSGKVVTPEGLIYTSVEFAQPTKAGKPAPKTPEEEPVVYSAVDFKKIPPAP